MGGIGGRSICHDLLARQFSLSQHMTNFNVVSLRYSAPVLDAGHVHAMACQSHLIIHLPYCSIEGLVIVLLAQIPKFLSMIVDYFSLMVRSNIVQLSNGKASGSQVCDQPAMDSSSATYSLSATIRLKLPVGSCIECTRTLARTGNPLETCPVDLIEHFNQCHEKHFSDFSWL